MKSINHQAMAMCDDRAAYRRQRGFSIITAIFLLSVLAMLGAFLVSVAGFQQKSSQLDIQGVRATQAARAGIEWGAYQVLRSAGCASTNLTFAGTTLGAFTTTVTCTPTTHTELVPPVITMYQITSTACNQPAASSCPNATPSSADYIERSFTITVGQ